jgi:hypothetical protein
MRAIVPHSNIDASGAVVGVLAGVRHADANVCAGSSIQAHSNITRGGTCPDTSMMMRSINIDCDITRPDANINASSINVDAAMRHIDRSVTKVATVQQGLQQQCKQERGAQPFQWHWYK